MRLGSGLGTTSALVAVVVVSLAAIDRFLAKIESSEISQTAQRDYRKGCNLLAAGEAKAALEYLNDAYSLERQNSDYELQLATAYWAAAERAAAEPLLQDVLEREPNSGPANLEAARWAAETGKTADAEAHYHRAIYGTWPAKQETNPLSTRMELLDLLARSSQKQELISELISVEALEPASVSVRNKLASLYLVAGAPNRAAVIYRSLVKEDASDVPAYEGLGNAEIQAGNYRAAGQAFFRALLKDPENRMLRDRVLILSSAIGLDPTPRQLTSAEKYRRSLRILEMALTARGRCTAPEADPDLVKASEAIVAGKLPAHATNEMAEQVLDLAVKLWEAQPQRCQNGVSGVSVLGLIMKKLTS